MAFKTYDCKIRWAKIKEYQRDLQSDHKGIQQKLDKVQGRYSVDMLVDEETKDQMIKDGIPESVLGNEQFKFDQEEGLWVYKAKRDHFAPNMNNKETGEKGVVLGEPVVIDYPKSKEIGERIPLDEPLGNGTEAKVKLEVAKLDSGVVIVRLNSIGVTNLVEYEGDVL